MLEGYHVNHSPHDKPTEPIPAPTNTSGAFLVCKKIRKSRCYNLLDKIQTSFSPNVSKTNK